MEQRYFLGLDGGGTKTHCVLLDQLENRIDFLAAGPSNHEVMEGSFEELKAVLTEITSTLLSRNGIGVADIAAASFGMGGVDTPIQHAIISQIIAGIGFSNFVLSNDAYLGVKAECSAGYGVCAVNGWGYSVVGINSGGDMLQIGGHGELSGDKGGGSYLVPAAIRSIYTSLFKGAQPTIMADMLFDELGVTDKIELVEAVAMRIMGDQSGSYLMLSKLLYAAANQGDTVALQILEESGADYALAVRQIVKALDIPAPVEVALVGSQFIRSECKKALETMEQALNPEGEQQYIIKPISTLPVAGALIWSLELGGMGEGRTLMERVHHLLGDITG